MKRDSAAASVERIEQLIYLIRGQRIMIDFDLARIYRVPTKVLNQAVKRNAERFPEDFMFRLSAEDLEEIGSQISPIGNRTKAVTGSSKTARLTSQIVTSMNRSQIVTGSQKHRNPRYLPYAFTEQGVAMLSSVLRSARAVEVNIAIMRTFVQLRRLMDSNRDLARKIEALEEKYDEQFAVVFEAIKQLITPRPEPPRRIGFHPS